ncbi:MAG: hypothetical protein ACTSRK_09950, partial [Promethearchaeota archaeon]
MTLTFSLCVFLFLALSMGLHLVLTVMQPVSILRSIGDVIKTISTVIHELLHFIAMLLMGMEVKPSDVHLKAGEIVVVPTHRNVSRNSFLKQIIIVFTPMVVGTCLILWMWWVWITPPYWGVRLFVFCMDTVFLAVMRPSVSD